MAECPLRTTFSWVLLGVGPARNPLLTATPIAHRLRPVHWWLAAGTGLGSKPSYSFSFYKCFIGTMLPQEVLGWVVRYQTMVQWNPQPEINIFLNFDSRPRPWPWETRCRSPQALLWLQQNVLHVVANQSESTHTL